MMMVWHSLFAQGKDSAIAAFRSPFGCQLIGRISSGENAG